jgi:hypothetical protein
MNNIETRIDQNTIGLPTQTAANMKKAIAPMAESLVKMEENFNLIVGESTITAITMESARQLRLSYQRVRVSAEKVKTQEKKTYLMAGNAIQGMFNIIKNETIPKEDKLKEIENYERIQAQNRREKLSEERKSVLNALAIEKDRQICEMPSDEELGGMTETTWQAYLSGTKHDLEEIVKLEEQERKHQVEIKKAEIEKQKQLQDDLKVAKEKQQELEAELALKRKEADQRILNEKLAAMKKEEEEKRIETEKYEAEIAPDREKFLKFLLRVSSVVNERPDIKDEYLLRKVEGVVAKVEQACDAYIDQLREVGTK